MQLGDTADILAKQNLAAPFYGWNLHVSDFGGVGVFIGRPADGSATPLGTSLVTAAAYDDLLPHVFALVLDRDADTMHLFTERESLGPASLSDIVSQPSAEPMRLGRTFADSEFVRRVATGEVAYVAIFDAALTPSQIGHFWSLAE